MCTHVVEQLLFSMFSSILTFDFDLILNDGTVQNIEVGTSHRIVEANKVDKTEKYLVHMSGHYNIT